MQHAAFSRSVAAISVIVLVGVSAVSLAWAQESGESTRMPPPPPPRTNEMSPMGSGATDRPMPPRPRDGTGAVTGSGNFAPPMERHENRGSGAVACTSSGLAGEWHGSLSMQVRTGTDYEFEGRFRLMDVGGDGTERTEDDVVYEGTFYASENSDGDIEAVFTAADGTVSDYATLAFVSENELEGNVSIGGAEVYTKSARACGKPPRPLMTGSGTMSSSGASVRMGRDGMEVRDGSGTVVRMDGNGMQIRREVRQEIRKALLTEALKTQIDARLEKMDTEKLAEFYPRVLDRLDTIIDKLPEGKKKQLYSELRDYLDEKWHQYFPEEASNADEDVLDEVFSE